MHQYHIDHPKWPFLRLPVYEDDFWCIFTSSLLVFWPHQLQSSLHNEDSRAIDYYIISWSSRVPLKNYATFLGIFLERRMWSSYSTLNKALWRPKVPRNNSKFLTVLIFIKYRKFFFIRLSNHIKLLLNSQI